MSYYIETSEGTVGIYMDDKNQSLEKECQEWLVGFLKHMYRCRKENPITIESNLEGLFLKIHLEDETLGSPEYKIRKRFIAQELTVQFTPNSTKEKGYSWRSWCIVL